MFYCANTDTDGFKSSVKTRGLFSCLTLNFQLCEGKKSKMCHILFNLLLLTERGRITTHTHTKENNKMHEMGIKWFYFDILISKNANSAATH